MSNSTRSICLSICEWRWTDFLPSSNPYSHVMFHCTLLVVYFSLLFIELSFVFNCQFFFFCCFLPVICDEGGPVESSCTLCEYWAVDVSVKVS